MHRSEESRRKTGDGNRGEKSPNYGKPLSEETRRKLSDALRGEKNANYGKSPSNETKRKISVGNKGKRRSEETKKRISKKLKEHWANGVFSGVFAGPTTIEMMLREFLDNNGIPYSAEKAIDIGYKTRKPDAFIEPNIILEADGEYYHGENCHGKNSKMEDERDDKVLKEMGYIIYRIPEPDFRNGKYLETLNIIIRQTKTLNTRIV